MTGKRKASDDAPRSSPPPPPQWKRKEDGIDDASNAGDYSGDSDSNMTYVSDYSEGSGLAGELGELNIQPPNQVPDDSEDLAAADGQHAEVEVPPPPPLADQHAAAEVSDQSVAAAAPAPEMAAPAAESALCLGCEREPALERLVPVKHVCLCRTCRCNPSGVPYCEYCDGPRH